MASRTSVGGRSDCPYFARCELLGDRLAKNLKKFNLHKIIIQPDQWEMWLTQICQERGWSITKSPVVWRELVDRGGKGVLIGGANDFQEYAKAYYGVESLMNSYDMKTVSYENKITKDICDEEERAFKALSKPVVICITNAASPICYYLISTLCSGQILGPGVEFMIRLLVSSQSDYDQVKGTAMEAEDLACGLLRDVKVTTSPHDAFENCSIIILLNNINRLYNESTKEWIDRNQDFFNKYGAIINDKALRSCKVLVSGSGPLNFDAMVIAGSTPNLSKKNIMAVTSVVENRAKSLIGEKLNVNQAGVVNLIVWGNINGKRYFDVNRCKVHGYLGAIKGPSWHTVDALEMIHDNKWIQKELPKLATYKYQKMFVESMGSLTGISIANSIASTLQNLCRGSPDKQIFSLGVESEGWYSVPSGIFFSFPVTMDSMGCWNVVEDIEVTKELRIAIDEAIQDINFEVLLCVGTSRRTTVGKYGSVSVATKMNMLGSATWDKFSADIDRESLWSQTTANKVFAEFNEISERKHETHEGTVTTQSKDLNLPDVSEDLEKSETVPLEVDSLEPSNLTEARMDDDNDAQDGAPLAAHDVQHELQNDTVVSIDNNQDLQNDTVVSIDNNQDLQNDTVVSIDNNQDLQNDNEETFTSNHELQDNSELQNSNELQDNNELQNINELQDNNELQNINELQDNNELQNINELQDNNELQNINELQDNNELPENTNQDLQDNVLPDVEPEN